MAFIAFLFIISGSTLGPKCYDLMLIAERFSLHRGVKLSSLLSFRSQFGRAALKSVDGKKSKEQRLFLVRWIGFVNRIKYSTIKLNLTAFS